VFVHPHCILDAIWQLRFRVGCEKFPKRNDVAVFDRVVRLVRAPPERLMADDSSRRDASRTVIELNAACVTVCNARRSNQPRELNADSKCAVCVPKDAILRGLWRPTPV